MCNLKPPMFLTMMLKTKEVFMPDEDNLKRIHDKLDLILSAFPERDGKPDPQAHRVS